MRKQILVAALLIGGLTFWTSTPAQDDSVGQTLSDTYGAAVSSRDLDSFWSEQRSWLDRGYRQQPLTQATPLSPVPDFWAHRNSYAIGAGFDGLQLNDPLDKSRVQLSSSGIWH